MTAYLDQFLYQGRPAGSSQPAGYHVVLGEVSTRFGREVVDLSDPMTPEAAAAEGFDLPAIIADIDAAVMADNTALRAEVAQLRADKAALEAQLAALRQQAPSA